MSDPYLKAMFGQNAIHVPINMIVQKMGDDGTVIGVFQTRAGNPMLYGSKKTHQLILGDAYIRPHLVANTNEMQGYGFSTLATTGFTEIDKWIEGGILLDPMGLSKKLKENA